MYTQVRPTLDERVANLPHVFLISQRADARWAAHNTVRFLLRKHEQDARAASRFILDLRWFETAMRLYCVSSKHWVYAQKVALEHLVKAMEV